MNHVTESYKQILRENLPENHKRKRDDNLDDRPKSR